MKIRVLILDDDDGVRRLLRQMLIMRGCDVLAFAHPGLCPMLTSDQRHGPSEPVGADLIIADLHMPVLGGLELIKHLQGVGCKMPKVVLISGDWSTAEAEQARRMGCDVLSKPFSLETLNGLLEECAREVNDHRVLADWSEGYPAAGAV